MNVAPGTTNHNEQAAACLQIQTCICAPEQNRLLSLMQSAKEMNARMSLKLLQKPPPTTVSQRVKLLGKAWEIRGERERARKMDCHIIIHTLNSNSRFSIIICINTLQATFPCFKDRLSCKYWNCIWLTATHKLSPLRKKQNSNNVTSCFILLEPTIAIFSTFI